jgi:hypothetical protein
MSPHIMDILLVLALLAVDTGGEEILSKSHIVHYARDLETSAPPPPQL